MTTRWAGAFLAFAAAAAQAAWGPAPQYIGDNLPVVQDNERFAKAIPDGDGGTFMVWVASDAFDPELRVYGQRVGADGRRHWNQGDPHPLAGGPGADLGNLGLAPDGQGGILAAWQRLEGETPVGPVALARFDRDGRAVWSAPASFLAGARDYLVTPAGDGGASVLGSVKAGGQETLTAARVSAAGAVLFEKAVRTAPEGLSLHAAPAAFPGAEAGRVLYLVADRTGGAPVLNAVAVAPDGSASVRPVGAGGLHPTDDPACHRFVAGAPDGKGGVWAAWVAFGARDAVKAVRLSAAGVPAGEPAVIDDDPKTDKFNLFAAADGQGGLLLQYAADEAGSLDKPCRTAAKHPFSADLWLWRLGERGPLWTARVGREATDDGHQVLAFGRDAWSSWVDQPSRNVLARRFPLSGGTAPRETVVGSYEGAGSLGITLMPGKDAPIVGWKQSENLYVQTAAEEGR